MVRLRRAMPEHALTVGMRGVVLIVYDGGRDFEVEFCDDDGNTIALVTLRVDDLDNDA